MRFLAKYSFSFAILIACCTGHATDYLEKFKVGPGQKLQVRYAYSNGATSGITISDNQLGDRDPAAGLISTLTPGEFGEGNKIFSKTAIILNADGGIFSIKYELKLSSLDRIFDPVTLPIFTTNPDGRSLLSRIDFGELSGEYSNIASGTVFSVSDGEVFGLGGIKLYSIPVGDNSTIDDSILSATPTYTGTVTVNSFFTTSPVPEASSTAMFVGGLILVSLLLRGGNPKFDS